MTVRIGYDLAKTSPIESEQGNAAVRFRGRDRKTTFGENGKNKTIVRWDSEHRIVTPQSKSAALRPADFTQGVPPYDPEKLAKEQMMSELYQIHSALRECGKYEPSAFGICTEIEQLVLDLQEVI